MIIGLSGYKQSGKDALADELVKLGFVKLGMSDILHECMLTLDPIVQVKNGGVVRYSTLVDEVGYVAAKEVPEVRRLLQAFGTDVGRKMLGENVWADAVALKLDRMTGDVVVTGIRFPNEAQIIEDRGLLVRVERPGFTGDAHESEHALDDYPFPMVIQNDGPLERLCEYASWLSQLK